MSHLVTLSVLPADDGPGGAIRNVVIAWATPILLLVIAILAIPHLIKQRFMALGAFALVAVVVFLLFAHPEILQNLADGVFGSVNKQAGGWTGQ